MHTFYSFQKILGDKRSGFLGQIFVLSDNVVQLSVTAQLQKCVEIGLIMKEAIDIDDVGVVKECLDFQLANELL